MKYNVSLGKEANITTSDNSTQYIVQQLRKYSPYYFTVQAVNKIGVGPPSVAVVNVTSEDGKFATRSGLSGVTLCYNNYKIRTSKLRFAKNYKNVPKAHTVDAPLWLNPARLSDTLL